LNRLRAGPKDTIPMVGKPPRKQRSSRFVVTEKVEIERLPPFMGSCSFSISSCHLATSSSWPNQRHLRPSGHSYSSRSFINVASCSISTMPALNSKANKLKRRLYMRCLSTLPLNVVSSPRMYTQRSSAWYVSCHIPIILISEQLDSLPPTSSDRYPLPSTQQEMPLTQKKTNRS